MSRLLVPQICVKLSWPIVFHYHIYIYIYTYIIEIQSTPQSLMKYVDKRGPSRLWWNPTNPTMHTSHIPQCTIENKKYAHFCPEWCIVGYGTGALWDLFIWFITFTSNIVIKSWDVRVHSCSKFNGGLAKHENCVYNSSTEVCALKIIDIPKKTMGWVY